MTDATASDGFVTRDKLGEAIFKMAQKRFESEEGKKELESHNGEEVMDILSKMTTLVDKLPQTYTLDSLFIALSYIGNVVVKLVEYNTKKLMEEQEGGRQ